MLDIVDRHVVRRKTLAWMQPPRAQRRTRCASIASEPVSVQIISLDVSWTLLAAKPQLRAEASENLATEQCSGMLEHP